MKKVFSTTAPLEYQSEGKTIVVPAAFEGNRAPGINKPMIAGVCLAMSMDWLMQSIRLQEKGGKPYVDKNADLARNHIGPVQEKYLKSIFFSVKKMAWYYKLKIDEKKTLKGKTSLESALQVVTKNPGYMFLFCTETHAMASAYLVNSALTKHEYLFFDPNCGLYCSDSANDFVSWVKNLVNAIYKPKSIELFSMVKE